MDKGGIDPTKPVMPFYALNVKTQEKISYLEVKWQVHFDWLKDVADEAKVKFAKPGEERELSLLPKTPGPKKSRVTRARKKESLSQAGQENLDMESTATTSSRGAVAKGPQPKIASNSDDMANSSKKKIESMKVIQEKVKSATTSVELVESPSEISKSLEAPVDPEKIHGSKALEDDSDKNISDAQHESIEAHEDPEKVLGDKPLEPTEEQNESIEVIIGDSQQELLEPTGEDEVQVKATIELLSTTEKHQHSTEDTIDEAEDELIDKKSSKSKVNGKDSDEEVLIESSAKNSEEENVTVEAQPEVINENSLPNKEPIQEFVDDVFESQKAVEERDEATANVIENVEDEFHGRDASNEEVVVSIARHNSRDSRDDSFSSAASAGINADATFDVSAHSDVVNATYNIENDEEIEFRGAFTDHSLGNGTFVVETEKSLTLPEEHSKNETLEIANHENDVTISAEDCETTADKEANDEDENEDGTNKSSDANQMITDSMAEKTPVKETCSSRTLTSIDSQPKDNVNNRESPLVKLSQNTSISSENSSQEDDSSANSTSSEEPASDRSPINKSKEQESLETSRSSVHKTNSASSENQDENSSSESKTPQKGKPESENKATRSTRTKRKKQLEAEAHLEESSSVETVQSTPTKSPHTIDLKSPPAIELKLANDDTESEGERETNSASRKNLPLQNRRSRRSSIAKSLLKVSAARNLSVADVLQTMDASLVTLTSTDSSVRKSPAAKKALGPSKTAGTKSRAKAGRVAKPTRTASKNVNHGAVNRSITQGSANRSITQGASARGMTPGARRMTPGSSRVTPGSVGSQNGGRVRSRLGIMRGTPGSSVVSKPRRPSVQEKMEEERKREEKAVEAVKKKEELMKQKTEEKRNKREARIKRVQEARQAKDEEVEKKRNKVKETEEKLAALAKRERRLKEEAENKRIIEERKAKEDEERFAKEAELDDLRNKEATLARKIREEEERKGETERKKEEKERRQQYEAKKREAERIAKDKENQKKIQQEKEKNIDLNTTYTKPSNALLNSTKEAGPTSYNMTPSRHGGNLPPEPLENQDNYNIEDLDSEGSTDDEDRPRKEVPKWAEGGLLRTALLKQSYMGPDLDKIFAPIDMPELSEIFHQQRKRFFKRTSSAVWGAAPTSFKHGQR